MWPDMDKIGSCRVQKFLVSYSSPLGWPYLTVTPPGCDHVWPLYPRGWPVLTDVPTGVTSFDRCTHGVDGQTRPNFVWCVCFPESHHFFISTEVKPLQKSKGPLQQWPGVHTDTRERLTRHIITVQKKWTSRSYEIKRMSHLHVLFMSEVHSTNRWKGVQKRWKPDPITHVFETSNLVRLLNFVIGSYQGTSFTARITSRRVHRDFATMLRKESIEDCLPDHDPDDLQRAVNTYHSFRQDTYKFIAKKHGVLSLRFTILDQQDQTLVSQRIHLDSTCVRFEYDRKSLCSIFDAVDRYRFYKKYGSFRTTNVK